MTSTKIIANDLIKRQVEDKPLKVRLLDYYGNPMAMETVVFTINGRSYNRDCDNTGYASLNINLPIGSYTCTIRFNSVPGYSGCTATVNVIVVERYETRIISQDLIKTRNEAGKVTAQCLLYNDEPVKNRPLLFYINGVYYTRTTDNNGYASLNINLPRGVYSCKIINAYDDYYEYSETTNTVKVISSTFMDGTNISKMEDETAVYQCAVYDELGRVQCNVTIKVNGVTYTRHTESDGLVKLNIRLPKGEYDIIAEFTGDESHTGSKVVNHISSKPYMGGLTQYSNGIWIPGDNTGFMESHVQVKQWSPEAAEQKGGVLFWDDTDQKFHKDIPFTSYEITETDPRVKTAKFTTTEYFDLTGGQLWVHISSPYHENFGGQIIKVDFDKDKELYTYQCQDGRRNYLNKFKTLTNSQSANVYYNIMGLLMTPLLPNYPDVSADEMDRLIGHKICSGLRPLDAYYLQSGVLLRNAFKENPGEMLAYDSAMDKIMNFAHYGGTPTDVYFTPEGICQIEPLDINTWIKTGFKLTHTDLTSYKYGFDTTNILTGVNFQTPDNTPIVNVDKGTTVNQELSKLGFYFGANIGMISPVTTQVTTETPTSSGGGTGVNNKGKTIVVACDTNSENDGHVLGTVCYTLENAGYNVINLGIGPGLFSSYDYSSSSAGKVGVYLMAGSTVSIADGIDGSGSFDYYVFGLRGDLGLRSTTQFDSAPWGADSDCTSICDRWVGHTGAEIAQMARDSGKGDVVYGNTAEEIAGAVLAAVNGESGVSRGTTTTTTTTIDVASTYKKAQEEVIKQGRNFLNFEVKLPLNHTMFKNLHTNQMFFTELPKNFRLGNLAELFKILPTYKINRGLGTEYQENRWYIEKQVIKCDSNGLFSTLTLNVLPSPYSPYTEKLRSYRDAYEQAFKQQENTNTGGGSSGSSDGLRWSTGVSELDSLISNAISGKTDDVEKARAIHNAIRDAGVMYAYYNNFNYSNTSQRWNAKDGPGLNCGDAAALVAESMKAAGLQAVVQLRCDSEHFFCLITCHDGNHFSDLTANTGQYSQRDFDEVWQGYYCGNDYDYPY